MSLYKKMYLLTARDYEQLKKASKNNDGTDNQISHIKLGDVVIKKSSSDSSMKDSNNKTDVKATTASDCPTTKKRASRPKLSISPGKIIEPKLRDDTVSPPFLDVPRPVESRDKQSSEPSYVYPIVQSRVVQQPPRLTESSGTDTGRPTQPVELAEPIEPVRPVQQAEMQTQTDPVEDPTIAAREYVERERERDEENNQAIRARLEEQFNNYAFLIHQQLLRANEQKDADMEEMKGYRDQQWMIELAKLYDMYRNSLTAAQRESTEMRNKLNSMKSVLDNVMNRIGGESARTAQPEMPQDAPSTEDVDMRRQSEERMRQIMNEAFRDGRIFGARRKTGFKRKKLDIKPTIKEEDTSPSITPPSRLPRPVIKQEHADDSILRNLKRERVQALADDDVKPKIERDVLVTPPQVRRSSDPAATIHSNGSRTPVPVIRRKTSYIQRDPPRIKREQSSIREPPRIKRERSSIRRELSIPRPVQSDDGQRPRRLRSPKLSSTVLNRSFGRNDSYITEPSPIATRSVRRERSRAQDLEATEEMQPEALRRLKDSPLGLRFQARRTNEELNRLMREKLAILLASSPPARSRSSISSTESAFSPPQRGRTALLEQSRSKRMERRQSGPPSSLSGLARKKANTKKEAVQRVRDFLRRNRLQAGDKRSRSLMVQTSSEDDDSITGRRKVRISKKKPPKNPPKRKK